MGDAAKLLTLGRSSADQIIQLQNATYAPALVIFILALWSALPLRNAPVGGGLISLVPVRSVKKTPKPPKCHGSEHTTHSWGSNALLSPLSRALGCRMHLCLGTPWRGSNMKVVKSSIWTPQQQVLVSRVLVGQVGGVASCQVEAAHRPGETPFLTSFHWGSLPRMRRGSPPREQVSPLTHRK